MVCVVSMEDNARVFMIVFQLRCFFLSWSDTATSSFLFPPFLKTYTHTLVHSSFWVYYIRETDKCSKKVYLSDCLQSSYHTFTFHPRSILNQFHVRVGNHFYTIENIFSLLIYALPVLIKLLGGKTRRLLCCCAPKNFFLDKL